MQTSYEHNPSDQTKKPLQVPYFPRFDELEKRIKAEIDLLHYPEAMVYCNRLENLAVFADPEKMHMREELLLHQKPEYERIANELIHGYLSNQNRPIDIAVILHGGLHAIHFLHDAINIHNVLFYRPRNSPNTKINRTNIDMSYLVGSSNPERKLLLIENDMLSGNTLRETAKFFQGQGYAREEMYAFLYLGAYRKPEAFIDDKYEPEIGQIEVVLDRSNDTKNRKNHGRWSFSSVKKLIFQ